MRSPKAPDNPAARPLRQLTQQALQQRLDNALAAAEGVEGAHCVHELWMRGAWPATVEAAIERLWQRAAATVPEWLPMTYVPCLPVLYEVAARFTARASGRTHLYLVLLDYSDRRGDGQGIYVGMSRYRAAARFDQHKAGIRAAGSVLKRGLEVLTGPVLHLQFIARGEAARIEAELALALADAGIKVEGGH
ncbi:MAG: hypothetical protein ABI859_02395 [Pseudomonadota bacterium]